jgi:hypothetical protein
LRSSKLRPADRDARERLSSRETLLTAKEGLPGMRAVAYAVRVSDDRTYRLIRRKPGVGTGPETAIRDGFARHESSRPDGRPEGSSRDAFAAKDHRVTERDLPVVVVPAGTQPEIPRYAPAPRPADLVDKRRFGNVEVTIEHRGDEISIVIPGVVRLTGTRADALSMIEALARTPRPA